jgi:hypothetical protein
MEIDKEIIIEYNKMLLDHSDTLLKVAGGLAVVNLLIIAHLRNAHGQRDRIQRASMLVNLTILVSGLSFLFGYLSNSVVVNSMSIYATKGTWAPDYYTDFFIFLQIIMLGISLLIFIVCVFVYRNIMLEALEHVGIGGG